MNAVRTRAFELMSSVTFHEIDRHDLEAFSRQLAAAIGDVVPDYPAIEAYLIEADLDAGDINYGLRFISVDPAYIQEIADEVLEKAVESLARKAGTNSIDAEREESVLVRTR